MNNNNSIQSGKGTPIHTHNLPPLELQAVGGAIRLARRNPASGRDVQTYVLPVRSLITDQDQLLLP
jgi:hypothetical protein